MFFAQDQRDNVREENPGISFGMKSIAHRIVSRLTHYRRPGRKGTWREMEGLEREAALAIREQGCRG